MTRAGWVFMDPKHGLENAFERRREAAISDSMQTHPALDCWADREDAMDALQRVNREGVTPQVSRPDPAKVVAGDPVHTVWSVEERGSLYAGMWSSTVGTWRCD